MSRSKEDVMEFIEENGVRFIRLQFTDIFGQMKNVAITPHQLEKAFTDRSEERRVGKECTPWCTLRWTPYNKKKQ